MAKKIHWESWQVDAFGSTKRRSACGNIRRIKWMTQEWQTVTCEGCRKKIEEKLGPHDWEAKGKE